MNRLLIILLLFSFPTLAQKQGRALIDSLVLELPKTTNDTAKGRLYRFIADEWFFSNVDQALYYSRLGLQHTTRMKWQRGIGVFNSYIGRAYSDKGNYDSCRNYFLKAIAIYKRLGDTWNLSSTTNNLGVAEQNIRSNYPAATRYYFDGLKYAEATGDNYLISLCLDNVSEIYRVQKNYPKALKFGQRSLALRQQQHNPDINAQRELAGALTSMAALYTQMQDWPKARQYGFQALVRHQKIDNREGLAKTYSNLSIAMQGDYQRKINYALKAKQLWDNFNSRNLIAVNNLANLGVAYFDLVRHGSGPGGEPRPPSPNTDTIQPTNRAARLQLAEQYLTEAIRLNADKGEVGDLASFRGSLAELQAMTGNYKGAYENFRAYQAMQDSLYSQESKNKIAELEGKREIEIRDNQLEINRLTIAGQNRQQIALMVGLGLLLVIGALLYWQNRTRKRTNTTLLRLNGELDEANRVKARFFAILSHDLRSPVANLISFLHLQRESPDLLPPDQVARHEQTVTEAAEGLLETMESMLLWSKGQMQHFKPDVKTIPVATLFDYLQRFFAGVADVQISFDAPEGLQVATDEDYLRTIMQNLTSNAINALKQTPNPNGGPRNGGDAAGSPWSGIPEQFQPAYIHWQAHPENGQVVLSITDNGPGMSESQLTTLYNDDAAISGKTGLGLHLIRDLARAIACQISVRSTPGAGTEFRLAFS